MFGNFWPQKGLFGPPAHMIEGWQWPKLLQTNLVYVLRIMHVWRIPKVSIFMAVTTKIVPEKAQKWQKMARFWPKWRYNGMVMAREVFLYQCLWVTKLLTIAIPYWHSTQPHHLVTPSWAIWFWYKIACKICKLTIPQTWKTKKTDDVSTGVKQF